MMGSKAFENPLIPHARMRALYRALVEVRVLGVGSLRRKPPGWQHDLEACWVGTAIDLRPGDLTSVSGGPWLLDYVRAIGHRTAQNASRAEVARVLKAKAAAQPGNIHALDRALCAVGMAQALKASGAGLAICYLAAGELSASDWKHLLSIAAQGNLPLTLVVTPSSREKPSADLSAVATKIAANVPVIPVDAGDAVALYRVAQETAVRARADGGVVVIECIACGTDPNKLLASQLVKKNICTERWVAAVEPAFRATLAKARN